MENREFWSRGQKKGERLGGQNQGGVFKKLQVKSGKKKNKRRNNTPKNQRENGENERIQVFAKTHHQGVGGQKQKKKQLGIQAGGGGGGGLGNRSKYGWEDKKPHDTKKLGLYKGKTCTHKPAPGGERGFPNSGGGSVETFPTVGTKKRTLTAGHPLN